VERMNSRERVYRALNHQITDRVPIDLGATPISGIHAVELVKLREELGLPYKMPVLIDPMTMIAQVDEDVRQALGVDCVGVWSGSNNLGIKNRNYKKWTLPDGTDVMVAGDFAIREENGKTYAYPQGDTSVPPSACMTTALYFDNIPRQEDLDEKVDWNAREDYKDQYSILDDETLRTIEEQANDLYHNTEYALVGSCDSSGLGDIFHVPGPWLKETKGIREAVDWYAGFYLYPEYIKELFAMQTEITLKNLKLYYEAVGNKILVLVLSGTDFGHQDGLFISKEQYRELFMPFYKQMTEWIRKNTQWKVFMHSCGSIYDLIPEFIESGFDIINPVQVSAKKMEAAKLKEAFGKDIVFWGGGCDPQGVLVKGTPEEVYQQTKRNAQILSMGGGLIGGNVHNVQYDVPAANLVAELAALRDVSPVQS